MFVAAPSQKEREAIIIEIAFKSEKKSAKRKKMREKESPVQKKTLFSLRLIALYFFRV